MTDTEITATVAGLSLAALFLGLWLVCWPELVYRWKRRKRMGYLP
jgi:hypothetical protein